MFVVRSYRDHIAINFDDGATMLWRAALVGHSTFEAIVYAPPVEAPPDVHEAWAEAGLPVVTAAALRVQYRPLLGGGLLLLLRCPLWPPLYGC